MLDHAHLAGVWSLVEIDPTNRTDPGNRGEGLSGGTGQVAEARTAVLCHKPWSIIVPEHVRAHAHTSETGSGAAFATSPAHEFPVSTNLLTNRRNARPCRPAVAPPSRRIF
jgi:hypothetical protein